MSEDKIVRKLRKQLETALAKRSENEAADVLGKLMAADPKVPRWPHKRGDLLRKLGQNRVAIDCYAEAATLYAEQGFIARAVAMAKTILNLDPSRIDVLERIDPEAARKLHRLQRPKGVSARPAAPRHHGHSAVIADDDDAPIMRHPALLPDDEDSGAPPPPMRHPALLPDDDEEIPPLPPPPAAAPRRHPMVLDDDVEIPPPMPPAPTPRAPVSPERRAATTLRGAAPARPVTLDRLSMPPELAMPMPLSPARRAQARLQVNVPPPPRLPDFGDSMLDVAELTIAPDVRPNETRFSNAPPALRRGRSPSMDIELSDIELSERERAVPLVASSLPPAPPSPMQLSQLPLFPLFAEVPKHALSILVQGAEVIELPDGAVVMRKGEIADALYGIVEGSVQIGVPGQQMRLTLAEGDVFGEAALLGGEKRHADVTVKGYLVALRITRPVLQQLLAAHPPLAEILLELLTRRLLGNLLQASPLFQEFDMRGRQEIVKLFEVRRAPAGTILASQGKMMDGLYINLTGELEVAQPAHPIQKHGAGTMFGHGCMLTQEPSAISVRALSNMLVLRLPGAAFHSLAMQYPAILAQVSDLSGSDVAQVVT